MRFDPSRRVFLKGASLAAVGVGFLPTSLLTRAAEAAGAGPRVLVQVFLRGGVDGLNLCVPWRDGDYRALRPDIGIAPGSVRDLDGFFGLHPALSPLLDLYAEGVLALHPTVGNAQLTRSHFDAQDFMDSGTPGEKTTTTGWLDRTARQLPGATVARSVGIASQLPRSLLGPEPEVVLQDLRTFALRAGSRGTDWSSEAESLLKQVHAAKDDAVYQSGREVFESAQALRSSPALALGPGNGARYPAWPVGDALRQAAQVIKADLGTRCIYVPVAGAFDTHANELAALDLELPPLADALVAFRRDLGTRIDDVLLMVTTEFGRTAAQNGSGGTDHGAAHCELYLGGSVRGRRVHGSWPGLSPGALFEQRDVQHTVDFRDVFASAARWLGAADPRALLPGAPGADPGLFG